jgi:Domain of unknown function (DUF1906)
MIKGIDYAFNPHPSAAAIKAAGFQYVGRYVSSMAINDTNGKNLIESEKAALHAAGIKIILFAEEGAARMLGGHGAGVEDARHFSAVCKGLGMDGAVMFACADFDATPGNQVPINAYLDGVASEIGHQRTGIYGSYYVVKRSLNAGKAAYACQTIAWSGGQWEPRAECRQFLQIRVGGVSVDLEHALRSDYGQWPRPSAPPKAKSAPDKPLKLQANGKQSLREAIHEYEGQTITRALVLMAQDPNTIKAGDFGDKQSKYIQGEDWDANMPDGMTYWVGPKAP